MREIMKSKSLRVLVACECSQTVCKAFRALGDECYSCDVEDQYGGHPEWHVKRNVLDMLNGDIAFTTQDGTDHYVFAWDLIIAHPPCTYLSITQMPLYNRRRMGDAYVDDREKKRERAVQFFLRFTRLDCPYAIENPPGYMNRHYKKPTQTIQPFWFGDAATKATCLWMRGLPRLIPTNIVQPPPCHVFPNSNPMGAWYYETSCLPPSDRARARSKTFDGVANAMATQWHAWLAEPFRLVPCNV